VAAPDVEATAGTELAATSSGLVDRLGRSPGICNVVDQIEELALELTVVDSEVDRASLSVMVLMT
jgi:hypothetical protein